MLAAGIFSKIHYDLAGKCRALLRSDDYNRRQSMLLHPRTQGIPDMSKLRSQQYCSQRNRKQLRSLAPNLEPLESRIVLDASVLITEIVAANGQGIRDEDGDRSDWIELYNNGDAAQDLTGWYLTDDAAQKTKWKFPAVTIQPEQHIVVFASGKDRTGDEIHTNFQLAREGEYVGLVRPDGTSVQFEYAPQFPALAEDRSFGLKQPSEIFSLVTPTSDVRVLVPTVENGGDQLGTSWTNVGFDDSSWRAGQGGVGLDETTSFDEFIKTDIEEEMLDKQGSAFIRTTFTVANTFNLANLSLGIQYDDGFVAYINGTEVARANAPLVPEWNSTADASHRDSLATRFEFFDLAPFANVLADGDNVLAVHGMNRQTTSDDFLIATEITATRSLAITDTTPGFFSQATPGYANGDQNYAGLGDRVVASIARGFYEEPIDVALTTETAGATLIYTTDGSLPTLENGTVIEPASPTSPPAANVAVDRTTTLRAIAVKDGFLAASAMTETYLYLDDVLKQDYQATLDAGFPEAWRIRTEPDYGMDTKVIGPNDNYDGEFASQAIEALKAAPTISIVTDLDHLFGEENGIYVNSVRTGFDWERPTSVEIMMPDGGDIQVDAGIRIAGDNVRNFGNSKKQSLRLEFREIYGPTKLRFKLFDDPNADTSFDTINLRGAYNDGWVHTPSSTQFIRDQWARTTLQMMGNPQVNGRFVHVYLNGFYWGVYNAVERPVASFAATYYGGDKDNWDSLNTGQIRDGSIVAWNTLRALARDVDDDDVAASNAAYLKLLGRNPDGTNNPNEGSLLDVQNYIDYLIVNFYGGNTDWPGRNYYAARERGPDSTGFKFFAWDTEKILDHGEGSTLTTNRVNDAREGSAEAYFRLRNNAEFRLQFADRAHQHFFNGGMLYVDPEHPEWDPAFPERNMPAATYAKIAQEIELPLIAESARWGDTQTTGTRQDGRTYTLTDWRQFRDRLFERYFPRRSEIVLRQLVDAGLYPEVAAPAFNQHGGTVDSSFLLEIKADGPVYYTVDGSDPRQSALDVGVTESGISPNAILYEGSVPLAGGGTVKARTLIDGEWSALNVATFIPAAPPLQITEIMYHPQDSATGDVPDDDFEFIELANAGTEPIDLSGVRLADGVEVELPAESLAAGERAVVVRNADTFKARYGADVRILASYGSEFKLNNGGESIRVEDSAGNVIEEFTYDDAWVATTDGGGYSLTRLRHGGDLSTASAWRSSFEINGTPGKPDTPDFNRDGSVTPDDVDQFCASFATDDLRWDLNGDGVRDLRDLRLLMHGELGTEIGDVNLNGVFDSADLTIVFKANEYEDGITGNSSWSEGDWNCDGDFTTRDFVEVFMDGGYVNDAAAQATVQSRTQLSGVAAALVDHTFLEERNRTSKTNRAFLS
ncbi:MAG: lamin tail domain-containing protein [Planctomycetales bacterium]|nr:lamin tail domain-containing protein [Planctomycetales bacterium]